MYVNKCIKCGREFETKNPKRVICPDCLYPDKKMMVSPSSDAPTAPEAPKEEPLKGYSAGGNEEAPRYYSAGGDEQPQQGYSRPQRSYNNYNQDRYNNRNQGGYGDRGGYQNRNQGGYQRQGGYNNRSQGGYNNRNQGGYGDRGGYQNRNQGGYQRQGGYNNRSQGGYNNQGNYQNRRPGGFNRNNNFNRRPQQRKAPKQLLVSKEQLEQIELLYKMMLPLPNPDCHEVIGEKIGLEPRKVFFGINLVRQKMMLPKLPFPKRKLAISPDQLFAIKNLYEPLLPLPPIGCHKIIAAQLKMDEWRVHVGIGLIRSQMGLNRWNEDRPDLSEDYKKQIAENAKKKEEEKKAKEALKAEAKAEAQTEKAETPAEVPAKVEVAAAVEETAEAPAEKPKRGRKPKKVEEEA